MPAIVLKLIVIRKRGVVISSKDVNIIEFRGGGRETLPVGGRIADGRSVVGFCTRTTTCVPRARSLIQFHVFASPRAWMRQRDEENV
jgi:hypothetical protein